MNLHHENLLRQNQYYRHEMMRFAERERLARFATFASRRSLLHPLLVWAGRRLVRAGLSLITLTETQPIEARTITYRQVV